MPEKFRRQSRNFLIAAFLVSAVGVGYANFQSSQYQQQTIAEVRSAIHEMMAKQNYADAVRQEILAALNESRDAQGKVTEAQFAAIRQTVIDEFANAKASIEAGANQRNVVAALVLKKLGITESDIAAALKAATPKPDGEP